MLNVHMLETVWTGWQSPYIDWHSFSLSHADVVLDGLVEKGLSNAGCWEPGSSQQQMSCTHAVGIVRRRSGAGQAQQPRGGTRLRHAVF